MKKKITIYSALIAAGIFLSTGCTKDFKTLNTDPVAFSSSDFDPNFLLTTAQLNYTGSQDFSYDTWRADLIYCSTMIQGFSTTTGYWAGDKYMNNPVYLAAYFGSVSGDGAYPEQVKPIIDMLQLTDGKSQYNNLHQIGRIMKSLIFERITDLYGDVPYSQSGLGFYDKILYPKYDAQKDIYTGMIAEVQDAVSKLNTSGDVAAGDAIYQGNVGKWQRFGNSLLLRMAMRLSKIDPVTAKSLAQSLVGKTMVEGDDAFVQNDGSGGRPTVNRVAQVLLGSPESSHVKWSQTFIDSLKNNQDPRLAVIAITSPVLNTSATAIIGGVADTSKAIGQPNGYDEGGVVPISGASHYPGDISKYSGPSANLIDLGSKTFILTYAQSELLWADAAERFGIGTATDHYTKGVTSAMTYLAEYNTNATISATAAAAYLTAHKYVPGSRGLTMINTQYWMLCNTMLDFYESWSNWRRTGLPVLVPVNYPGNATGGTIPRRFPYPQEEANTNPVNYTAAHNSVPGGDLMTGRVWWDPAQ